MTILQNFDFYFPIRLWRSSESYWRFEAPLLGDAHEYRFPTYFWDPWMSTDDPDYEKMKDFWEIETIFWAFNPNYALSLNRGFVMVQVLQQYSFPHPSQACDVFLTPLTVFRNTIIFERSFGFGAYAFSVIDTNLLYIHVDSEKKRLLKVVFCQENECPYSQEYNFLPSFQSKSVPFYDIRTSNLNYFFYVFREKPRGQYFRLSTEGICLPSESKHDFMSFHDCMLKSISEQGLRTNIYTQSGKPSLQSIMYTYPPPVHIVPSSMLLLSIILFLCFSVYILLLQYQQYITRQK